MMPGDKTEPSTEARIAGAKLCADIEGWCPADPDVPDSEIGQRKGRHCGKAVVYARALDAFAARAVQAEQEACAAMFDDAEWPAAAKRVRARGAKP